MTRFCIPQYKSKTTPKTQKMGAAFGEAVNLSLHLNKNSVFALPAMRKRAFGSMLKCGRETNFSSRSL